ncbi:MAG: hypothetical protein QNJ47_17620 [Nostocaceae cyanobacterium]|nr:hypothetical protein [Nostocaceae cyanobacterium]
MKIDFERSGGFAGISLTYSVDTESISENEAYELQQMITTANFFNLPAKIAASPSGADQFNYKITVENEGQQYTVETGDMSAPPTLQPLLQKLNQKARSRR